MSIFILDVNDCSPKFKKTTASSTVLEGAALGSLVYKAEATDLDVKDNSLLTYKIVGADPIQAKYIFDIDKNNGKITIAKEVNRKDFSR